MSYYRKSYNYSTLGTNCLRKTIAENSNTKFLLPLNNYYYNKHQNYNLNYKTEKENEDIYSEFNVNGIQNEYEIKDEIEQEKNQKNRIENIKTFPKQCSTCKS